MVGIIELLIVLAIVGLIAWALINLVPMPSQVRTVIIAVVVLVCLLIVLRAFGGFTLDVPQIGS